MSDYQHDPTWWQASDGKWYPPQPSAPGPANRYGTAVPSSTPGGWGAQPSPTSPYSPYSPYAATAYGSSLPSVNGNAVASMVLGISGLVLALCIPFISIVTAIVGLPLGIVALSKINRGVADPSPKGMAIAGVVMNGLCLVGGVLLIIFVAAAFSSMSVS